MPKGEIVGYLFIGFIIVSNKYSALMWNMMFQHEGQVVLFYASPTFKHAFPGFKESTPISDWSTLRVLDEDQNKV